MVDFKEIECKSGDILGISVACTQNRTGTTNSTIKYVDRDNYNNNNNNYKWIFSYNTRVFKNGKLECQSNWTNKKKESGMKSDKIGISPFWLIVNQKIKMRVVFEPQWMRYKMPNGCTPLCVANSSHF